jgi:hypothetical protein
MLGPMRAVDQFRELESRLPAGWADVRLAFTVDDPAQTERALALLGPLGPGRSGNRIQLTVPRAASRVELLRRLLARVDRDRILGTLELVTVSEAAPERPAVDTRAAWPPLEEAWMSALAALPEDWSDLYVEVELASSAELDRGALLLSPVNPARPDRSLAFRFRVARSFGYGASAEMTRRCLARLDAEGIKGRVQVLRALSDTKAVATQGPVWYVGGKAV